MGENNRQTLEKGLTFLFSAILRGRNSFVKVFKVSWLTLFLDFTELVLYHSCTLNTGKIETGNSVFFSFLPCKDKEVKPTVCYI